jgi:pyruvate/2-oxoglutarate dehydrogenase complex dihydrolipoamide dehydrogenase (E3) component
LLLNGHARFADPHTLTVGAASGEERRLTAAKIVIAVGTVPARPATVAFDGHRVLSSDDILGLDWLPSSLVVVGAGVIGIEYASMFAALGCKVTVVEQRRRLLEFCDSQIIEALQYHLRDLNVIFRFDEKVTAVEKHGAGAVTHLASGKLLGVHAFGTGATELVHIGQLLMTTGGTVEVLVDTVFNYPTLAESYKVAALDAMNRLRAVERLAA